MCYYFLSLLFVSWLGYHSLGWVASSTSYNMDTVSSVVSVTIDFFDFKFIKFLHPIKFAVNFNADLSVSKCPFPSIIFWTHEFGLLHQSLLLPPKCHVNGWLALEMWKYCLIGRISGRLQPYMTQTDAVLLNFLHNQQFHAVIRRAEVTSFAAICSWIETPRCLPLW